MLTASTFPKGDWKSCFTPRCVALNEMFPTNELGPAIESLGLTSTFSFLHLVASNHALIRISDKLRR